MTAGFEISITPALIGRRYRTVSHRQPSAGKPALTAGY